MSQGESARRKRDRQRWTVNDVVVVRDQSKKRERHQGIL